MSSNVTAPAGAVCVKTTNSHLQNQLDNWVSMIAQCFTASSDDIRRQNIRRFTESFVPLDVQGDDLDYFSNNLINDEV